MEMKICRIDLMCDTSRSSVKIDERMRKIFVGKADDDLLGRERRVAGRTCRSDLPFDVYALFRGDGL